MSKSIIEDLYYGRCMNDSGVQLSKNYKSLLSKHSELTNELLKDFSKTQDKIFLELDSVQNELEAESELESFKEGLKVGIRLGIECMEEKE